MEGNTQECTHPRVNTSQDPLQHTVPSLFGRMRTHRTSTVCCYYPAPPVALGFSDVPHHTCEVFPLAVILSGRLPLGVY